MRDISVVTVNFNQPGVTVQLIDSIVQHCPELPEIIVVDNGSAQNHLPSWQINYPFVKFIRSEINLGFAGGNNLGILQASGEYIFLVNNDTEFTPGLAELLAGTLKENDAVGAISPKIRFHQFPDIIQYAGYTAMNYYTIQNSTVGLKEKDSGQYDNLVQKTWFAHGAAMMLKRSAIDKAGLMPENFFLYYEEMDWCERIRESGFEIWVNTNALIYHKESVSVGQRSALREFFMNRNRILFARRNSSLPQLCSFYIYFIFLVVPRNILVYLKEQRISFIQVLMRAIWWNFTHRTTSHDLGYRLNNIK